MDTFPSANLILGKNRWFSLSLPYSSQQSNCQGTARAGCSPPNRETSRAGQPTGQGPCQPKPAPKQGSRVGSVTSPDHQAKSGWQHKSKVKPRSQSTHQDQAWWQHPQSDIAQWQPGPQGQSKAKARTSAHRSGLSSVTRQNTAIANLKTNTPNSTTRAQAEGWV